MVHILIVDDDSSKRFALKAALQPLGYTVVEADSGYAALRCAMTQDFAVILLDVRMPIMDGFETAQLLRQRRQSELTPVIFITAHDSEAIANLTAYDAGAADFIYSPVPPSQLRAKVRVFANLYLRAEALARQAREIRESADELTLLTDSAPIGIFRTDLNNCYTYVNPRWTELTGITADQAVGNPWEILLSPTQVTALVGARPDVGRVGPPFSHRFEITRHETIRTMLHVAKPVFGGEGTSSGWVGTLSDVTDEMQWRAEATATRDAAVAANEMQSNFAASASHELRTPTASVLGFIEEVLENPDLAAEDREYLNIAHRNAKRLSKLIDDLLIVGEADIGAAMMHTESVPVLALVEFVVTSFAATAQATQVDIVVETDAETDAPADTLTVEADPLRLEQALSNLISNAVKFNRDGGQVTISIGGFGDTVRIAVQDTGIGIEAASIDRIFDRFFRTAGALNVGVKGSGLGLAIAQRMVEAQNGTMSATSVLGEGSTFTITLPAIHPRGD
ncbi:sensor histidine kinase [Marisediminicola senii]|uniref:sensor histidine kinase n=1 Tax=Marisediminicola senii TaxID=2711233 RepID=UPI0013EACAF2|nr:ATP-binding protein [Marisediminicola senii]